MHLRIVHRMVIPVIECPQRMAARDQMGIDEKMRDAGVADERFQTRPRPRIVE